jgi:hypothetical protein
MYILTTKTKQITRATEMKSLKAITRQVTRAHSERVREVQDVVMDKIKKKTLER